VSAEPALLVGQSGGPTPVINASLAGLLEEAARLGAFPRILGLRQGIEGAIAGDLVPLDGLGPADWEALARTPAAALGSCRHRPDGGEVDRILDTFAGVDGRWLCYVGGNDSMDTGDRLHRAATAAGRDLAVWGVPKTIDNDLEETDHSPGYGSAARYWAVSTQEATLDLVAMRTYDRVLILETMGRNSGWLTAACALYRRDERDGPHLLLVPERPFDPDAFLARVESTLERVGYCVVATAETIRDGTGEFVALASPAGEGGAGVDRFGHPILTGVGEVLARLVTARLGVKARVARPGTLQRSSAALVSPVDLAEAREAGRWAARHLAAGESGGMVALARPDMGAYRCEYGVVALERVANRERRLPARYLEPDGAGVTPAFLEYAVPLLGPAPPAGFRLA
jgi:ATP-dependent phosphofructokinase / diphosphate-dependent phosphofructokinase